MIYLDNASTTKTSSEVNQIIANALENDYFNPSALHTQGFSVGQKIKKARNSILNDIKAAGYSLIFTGSATEANNMALAQSSRGKILVGAGEHPSVREKAKEMTQNGREVEFLPLNNQGEVDLAEFKRKMTADVTFVSVQMVSNETGAINNIKEICKIAKSVNPKTIVHSDMVQALGKIPVNLKDLNIDMVSLSAHKISGPKGIGALVFKQSLHPKPIIFGGGQENGLRSGTENVPQILAFKEAVSNAVAMQKEAYQNALNARNYLIEGFKQNNLEFTIHGNGSPFVLSLSFAGLRGETLMHALEQDEILISTGSACSSKKIGNVTLEAMGCTKDDVLGNVRISFGQEKFDDQSLNTVINAITKRVCELKK